MLSNSEPLFDPSECEPIPCGTYSARVHKAEVRTSKAGNRYLSCDIQIITGEHQGRLVDCNFHIYSTDSKFRADSRRKLARLTNCCGIGVMMKPEELLDKPFLVEIGKTTDSFGDTNNVVGFEKQKRG